MAHKKPPLPTFGNAKTGIKVPGIKTENIYLDVSGTDKQNQTKNAIIYKTAEIYAITAHDKAVVDIGKEQDELAKIQNLQKYWDINNYEKLKQSKYYTSYFAVKWLPQGIGGDKVSSAFYLMIDHIPVLQAAIKNNNTLRKDFASTYTSLEDLTKAGLKLKKELSRSGKVIDVNKSSNKGIDTTTSADTTVVDPSVFNNDTSNLTLVTNVAAVKEAYFTTRPDFLIEAEVILDKTTGQVGSKLAKSNHSVVANNRPITVAAAADLWTSGQTGKGMFVNLPNLDSRAFSGGKPPKGIKKSSVKYGFQFQYNPTSVSMSFAMSQGLDMGYEATGNDPIAAVGNLDTSTASQIKFEVLLNRMFDMKYYSKDKPGVLMQKTHAEGGPLYPGRQPVGKGQTSAKNPGPGFDEQAAIYNKGTMYDIEFLLRTVLGYTQFSSLRSEQTADIGFIGAKPVELHLGANLRYIVSFSDFTVNHVFFNERMVPILSYVSFTCYRLPDAIAKAAKTNTKGTKPKNKK